MRALQFRLRKDWDFGDREALVFLGPVLPLGSSVVVRRAKFDPRGTAEDPFSGLSPLFRLLDQGWGASLGSRHVLGLWSESEKVLSINMRELLAIRLSLKEFLPLISNKEWGSFATTQQP